MLWGAYAFPPPMCVLQHCYTPEKLPSSNTTNPQLENDGKKRYAPEKTPSSNTAMHQKNCPLNLEKNDGENPRKNDGEKPYATSHRVHASLWLMVEACVALWNKIFPIILHIYIVNKKTLFTLKIPPIYCFIISFIFNPPIWTNVIPYWSLGDAPVAIYSLWKININYLFLF